MSLYVNIADEVEVKKSTSHIFSETLTPTLCLTCYDLELRRSGSFKIFFLMYLFKYFHSRHFWLQSPQFCFGKPTRRTKISLQIAPASTLFCIADFTWAPCQDTVYTASTERCLSPDRRPYGALLSSAIAVWHLTTQHSCVVLDDFSLCLESCSSFDVKSSNWHQRLFFLSLLLSFWLEVYILVFFLLRLFLHRLVFLLPSISLSTPCVCLCNRDHINLTIKHWTFEFNLFLSSASQYGWGKLKEKCFAGGWDI